MKSPFALQINPGQEFVCAYARTSTGHQQTGVPQQFLQIDDYAMEANLPSPEKYDDDGVSGRTLTRVDWDRMWADIAQHKGTHLLVWDVGRLCRDFQAAAQLTTLSRAYNVIVHDCDEGRLTDTRLAEKAVFFTAEARKIATNLRRGTDDAVRAGRYPFKVLPGYMKDGDGRLVEDPFSGPIMREALARKASGHNWGAVADYVNSCGLRRPHGELFDARTIAPLCKNPVYTGVKNYNSRRFEWEQRAESDRHRTDALTKHPR